MAFLKLLISLGIIIAAMALPDENWTDEIQTAVKYSLLSSIKPTHYNIELILPIEEDIYRGESNISIEIYEETQHIELHLANLVVTESTLINENLQESKNNIKKSVYKPMRYSYIHEINSFIIYFNDKILPGNYILNLEFLGKATNNTEGLFRTSYKNEKGNTTWLFATYLQATGARQLFPCWDEPKLEATFTISVKHPQKYTALSNMPIREKYNVENDMRWTHFNTTPSMSPYLVAIAVIDFKTNNTKLDIRDDINSIVKSHFFNYSSMKIWFREEIEYESFAYYVLTFFTVHLELHWHMSSLKMIPKVDYIAIPDFPEKVIETGGLVLYREADIFHKPNDADIMSRAKLEYLISRNMIDEFLHDMPSWFKEGFGSFAFAYTYDKIHDNSRKMDLLVVQNQHESLRLNFYFNRNLLQINKPLEINSLPSSFRYNRAISILRMLQHLITEEVFQHGIKTLLTLKLFRRMTPETFLTTMQNTLNEFGNEHEYNLTEKMDGWMKHKNYPILKVTPDYAGCTNILLENFDSIDSDMYNLWIPITYTTQKNLDFNKTSHRNVVWVKSTQNVLCIDAFRHLKSDGWIIINLQQVGYYRVNYNTENWNKIAKYLNSMEYENIHVLNRAQIIDDAYHFLMTSQIDSSVFWELTNYLSREKDYIVWYPMIKALEYMSSVFPLSDRKASNIKGKIRNILSELLQNIGYNEDINKHYFINCLKQEASKWACILGEPDCHKTATSNLQQHLANRTTNKLLPWWEEWTYCNGLAMSGVSTWNHVFNVHIEEPNNKYLKFLACSENIAIIQNYMIIMASDNYSGKMKDKDRVNSFHFIVAKHAKKSVMLDFILSNFNEVTPRQASTVAILIDIINHVYSEEQLAKIHQFVEDYAKELIFNVKRKIEIRSSEIKNQKDYLQILTNQVTN